MKVQRPPTAHLPRGSSLRFSAVPAALAASLDSLDRTFGTSAARARALNNIPDSCGAHSSGSFSNRLGEVLRTGASKESIQPSQGRRSGSVTSRLTTEVGRRKTKVPERHRDQ